MKYNTNYNLEDRTDNTKRFEIKWDDKEYFKYVQLNARFSDIMMEHDELLRLITKRNHIEENVEPVKQIIELIDKIFKNNIDVLFSDFTYLYINKDAADHKATSD